MEKLQHSLRGKDQRGGQICLAFPLGLALPLLCVSCPRRLGRPWMMFHPEFEMKAGLITGIILLVREGLE